jgi:hypothetical protein
MGTILRTLSSRWTGISIILLSISPLSAQQLVVQKVWEFGAVDGPPETIWERIVDATILHGQVLAVDLNLAEVRAYSLSGEYLGLVGGRGQGPGEFLRPASIQRTGDSLRVYDILQKRSVIIDPDGRAVRTRKTEFPPRSNFFHRVWKGRHGWWIGETGLIGRQRPSECDTVHYTIVWKPFEETDTIGIVPGNPYWIDAATLDSLVMHTVENLGPAGGTWVLGDSVLVLVDGNRSDAALFRIGPNGPELRRTKPLPGSPSELTADDRKAAAQAYFRKYDVDPSRTSIRGFVLPEFWSAWTRVRGDDKGGVWLRRGGPELIDPARGERWVRWDLETDDFLEVEMPPGVEIHQFGEGHAVGFRRDGLGVQYLLLYRIVESG